MITLLEKIKVHLAQFDAGQLDSIDYFKNKKDYERPIIVQLMEAGQHHSFYNFEQILDELLKRGANINERLDDSPNALHAAICSGRLDMVKLLMKRHIDCKANYSNIYKCEFSPIQLCAEKKKYDILYFLVEQGFDINSVARTENAYSQSALMIALDGENEKDTQASLELIKRGADIHATYSENDPINALFSRQALVNSEIRQYLFDNGLDCFILSKERNSILHYCSDFGQIEAFKFYCEKGVDPFEVNQSQANAFEYFNTDQIRSEMQQWYQALSEQKTLNLSLNHPIQEEKQKFKI